MVRPVNILSVSLIALLWICGCTSPSKNQRQDEAQLYLKNGTAFFTNKQYPAAMRDLQRAEELDPENPVIQNNLALTYFVRERYDLALKHIDRAIKINSAYSEARNNRARILIELGRYGDAITEATRVTKDLTYGSPVRGWLNIALARFRMADYSGAKKTATEALKIERENCSAQTILGRSHLELNELKEAAETLDRALAVCESEESDEAGYFSGFARYKLGQVSAAVSRLESVVKANPDGTFGKRASSLLEIIR